MLTPAYADSKLFGELLVLTVDGNQLELSVFRRGGANPKSKIENPKSAILLCGGAQP